MEERLLQAIHDGDITAVETMTSEDPEAAEARDGSGVSFLMHALYHRQTEIARLLAERKRSVDLYEAAAMGDAELVKALANFDTVRKLSPDGFTALQFAAYFGHIEAARVLIEAGSEIDRRSENGLGVAPIHAALASGHVALARHLIASGADVLLGSAEGFTPLHYCGELGEAELARELLDMGADPKAKTRGGQTPSDVARASGHDHVAEVMDRS